MELGELFTASALAILPSDIRLSRRVLSAGSVEHAPPLSPRGALHPRPDSVVLCLESDFARSAATFRQVQSSFREVPIIIAANPADPEHMRALLRLGPADFMLPPFRSIDLLLRLSRFRSETPATGKVIRDLKERFGLEHLVGESPAMLEAYKKMQPVAQCDASVLISGETGTGKELFARAIHYLSRRSGKAFVPVNAGAIPADLVENELFGHQRGAFTGADASSPGMIREAENGTLFLDEIDSLPLSAQVKLLRFLQEKEFRPLGSAKSCKADVRVIAASNTDLAEAARSGRFRQDLFFRLNVIPLQLPPLRERSYDLPQLARHFLRKYAVEFDKSVYDFTPEALVKMAGYHWPGNVRELENIVERAVVLSRRGVIRSEELDIPSLDTPAGPLSFRELKARAIADFERRYLEDALNREGGNITRAARAARKNRRAFWELIRKHRLQVRPSGQQN